MKGEAEMETLNQSQEIFKRVETKYLLNTDQYRFVSGRMGQYMEVDQYGKDTINSIYFDTPDYQMIRRSLEKPLYKEKLRLRTYGQGACQGDPSKIVYAEIKKKYKGIVYKRRQPITQDQAEEWLYRMGSRPLDTQIAREIDYMLEFYRPQPAVYIGCERIAMAGKDDPNLRATFDFDIRYRTGQLRLSQGSLGKFLIDPEAVLLEVKVPGAMPLWMVQILEEAGARQTSFSKYGTYYRNVVCGREDLTQLNINKKESQAC